MKKIILKPILYILFVGLFFASCAKEDIQYEIIEVEVPVIQTEVQTVEVPVTQIVEVQVPYSYEFARAGKSTVSFSGQTARLDMADAVYLALKSNTYTKEEILEMFNDGTGFADESLNTSGKKMGNKTASSPLASATVKPLFDAMITD